MQRNPIMFLILAALARSQCLQGCLKCDANNTCVYCDVPSGYFNSGGRCLLSPIANCQVAAQDGSCTVCADGYFADPNTRKCTAVPDSNLITGCKSYNQRYACIMCKAGFYLNLGNCLTSNLTVANCNTQDAAGSCLQCASGYLPMYNLTGCLPLPTTPNCLAYSYVTCSSCLSGYFLNPNFYLSSLYSPSSVLQLINSITALPTTFPANVCQQGSVPNCANYTSPTTCSGCQSGYYLQSGACFAFPTPVVPNCRVYSNISTCVQCVNQFFLVNNQCFPVTPVDGCVAFDGRAPATTCVACNDTTFLSGTNTCSKRVASLVIQNCVSLSLTADACSACAAGFVRSSDNLLCLPSYTYCLLYDPQSTPANPICAACQTGFYRMPFNGTHNCDKIVAEGCSSGYSSGPGMVCNGCYLGYILDSTTRTCLKVTPVKDCVEFAGVNECRTCATGTIKFRLSNACDPTPTPQFCATFSSSVGCTACISGFYLKAGVCTAVPLGWGPCVSALNDATVCSVCATGYTLLAVSGVTTCVALPDYLTANCQTTDSSLTGTSFQTVPAAFPATLTNYCLQCAVGSLPFFANPTDAVCISNDSLKFYFSFTSVYACARYGLTKDAIPRLVCMECQSGFFISGYWNNLNLGNAITCVQGCVTNGLNVILLDDFFGFRNICVTVGSATTQINYPSCSVLARYQIQVQGVWANAVTDIQASDWFCVTPSTGSYRYLTVNNVVLDATRPGKSPFWPVPATTTSTDVTQAAIDFFPFTVSDSTPSPTIFNMRAPMAQPLDSASIPLASGQTLSSFTNCDYLMLVTGGSIFSSSPPGFVKQTNNFVGCLRCRLGYQIAYTVSAASNNPAFPTCQAMDPAVCTSASVQWGGLLSLISAMVSCHTCAASGGNPTYPTFWMEQLAYTTSGNPGHLLQYSLPTITNNVADPKHGFRCSAAPTTVTTSNSVQPVGRQVANCAVYGVYSAVTTINSLPAAQNSYCFGCATGYYPIYSGTGAGIITNGPNYNPVYMVVQCVASANCDTSAANKPYNSCGKCSTAGESQTPPVYYAYSDNRLINCLAVTSPNCLIIASSGSTAPATGNLCAVCQAGYYLNGDKYCEKLQLPNQDPAASFTTAYYAAALNWGTTVPSVSNDALYTRTHYLLSTNNNPYGISACSAGYTLAPPSHYGSIMCVGSPYLTLKNGTYPTGTVYISKCAAYFATKVSGTSTLKCAQCQTGWMINLANSACVTPVANCKVAQTATPTLCHSCATGYYNVAGVCVNTPIDNCRVIGTTSASPSATHTCASCIDGYYLNAAQTTCTIGNIQNCATYSSGSATNCLTCRQNYVKMNVANQILCLALNGFFPVCRLDAVGVAQQAPLYGCTDCYNTAVQSYRLVPIASPPDRPLTVCISHPLIPNCLSYTYATLNSVTNTFPCSSCASGFYLDTTNNVCVARRVTVANCDTVTPTSDTCSACLFGYYLDPSGLSCVAYPTGMQGCFAYSSNITCTQCYTPFYLELNGTCSQSVVIANCAAYKANNTCTACASGFFLANTTACVQATATNCLTYVNISACASCPTGYGLQTASNKTNCVLPNVANCRVATSSAPFACLSCNAGFYVSNGTCVLAAGLISNCLSYDSNTTCAQCAVGFLLTSDRTACNSTLYNRWGGVGCNSPAVTDTPQCTACQPGYLFSNGACVSCSTSLLASGCAACDPNTPGVCLWCQSGKYYMDSSQVCRALGNSSSNNQTDYKPASASVLSVLLAFITLILIN